MSFEDSLWHSTAGDSFTPRPPLPGDIDVDVAIVGAGYTGLWTAYYLHGIDPSLRIAIVEREIAGFGASGRNGGWCSALFPPASTGIARRHGAEAAVAMRRAMHEAVVEVGRRRRPRASTSTTPAVARFSSRATRRSSHGPANWLRTNSASRTTSRGLSCSQRSRPRNTRARRECLGAPTPLIAPRSTRCASCAGSPPAWSRAVSRYSRAHRRPRSSPARCSRSTARCAPRSSCARPRATRQACAASGAG